MGSRAWWWESGLRKPPCVPPSRRRWTGTWCRLASSKFMRNQIWDIPNIKECSWLRSDSRRQCPGISTASSNFTASSGYRCPGSWRPGGPSCTQSTWWSIREGSNPGWSRRSIKDFNSTYCEKQAWAELCLLLDMKYTVVRTRKRKDMNICLIHSYKRLMYNILCNNCSCQR